MNVFPTPVGMFRGRARRSRRRRSFPHACGDVPPGAPSRRGPVGFSPRLWGCSGVGDAFRDGVAVFPTPVGMFRTSGRARPSSTCFPHACGDVPPMVPWTSSRLLFSPRLWGCSGRWRRRHRHQRVFPTPVGMFRDTAQSTLRLFGFPHACGDVPESLARHILKAMFSPRLWGCSVIRPFLDDGGGVFPTPVGMFRKSSLMTHL